MKTNVVLVDGRKVTREGLVALLEKHADISVVGDADDSTAAPKLISALSPHVVVLLVTTFTPQVADRIRSLSSRGSGPRVVALLMHLDAAVLRRAFEAGAAGCLSKDCASTELVAAIRTVRSGKTYLSPRATDEVVNTYVLGRSPSTSRDALSAREQEVLQRIADGQTTKQIAKHLGVSTKTIETYRRRLMEKLDLHSVAELTKYAVRQGISPLEARA